MLNLKLGNKYPSTVPTIALTATVQLIGGILHCTPNQTIKSGINTDEMFLLLGKINSPREMRQGIHFELMFLGDEKVMEKRPRRGQRQMISPLANAGH